MVTMGDNRNQTVIIGDTFNIEIQRRSRLRCTSNMGSFNVNNIFRRRPQQTRDIPVFTSWLVWDEIQTEEFKHSRVFSKYVSCILKKTLFLAFSHNFLRMQWTGGTKDEKKH